MWIEIKQSREWIPFDSEHTAKVFYDGEKGWAVKQKDGQVYHVPEKYFEEKMLRELDSEAYWKKKQIEDAAKGLGSDDLKQIRKMLEKAQGKHKDKEED